MTQSELEQWLAGAIEPIADVLAELAKRIDTIEPATLEAARVTMREIMADTLIDLQRSQIELRESACRSDRSADALRAQVAEAVLALERAQTNVRDGHDGVGIRAVSLSADEMMLTLEFSDDTRFDCPLLRGHPGDRGEAGIGIDAPAWQAGVYRQHTVVQHYEGRSYRALADTADEPGDSPAWERLGRLGQRWCGPFQEGRSYEAGDYYVNGGTFCVLASGEHRCLAPKPLAPSEVRTICGKQIEEVQAIHHQAHAAVVGQLKHLAESLRLQISHQDRATDLIAALTAALTKANERVDVLTRDMQAMQTIIEDLQKGGRAR